MSIDRRFSKSKGEKAFTVRLAASASEPWAALGAYQALLEQAKLHGLEDIDSISITVDLHVSGRSTEERVHDLEVRMDQMYLGEVDIISAREINNV